MRNQGKLQKGVRSSMSYRKGKKTWIAYARKCEMWNNKANVDNFKLFPMMQGVREKATGNEVKGVAGNKSQRALYSN